jgi:hypothetical protein
LPDIEGAQGAAENSAYRLLHRQPSEWSRHLGRSETPVCRPTKTLIFQELLGAEKEVVDIAVPPGAVLFTADTVSMYTNIQTHQALRAIAQYLQRNEFIYQDLPIEALISTLHIVVLNNVFTFGDTTWHQLSGTAMGTPPAPPYATVFYGIHADTFLDRFSNLRFYK